MQDTNLLRLFNFVPGLQELLRLRQAHALEHTTVWILSSRATRQLAAMSSEPDNELIGGMFTDRVFYLYGQMDTVAWHHAVK